jgi:hypothetical protein
MNAKHLGDSYDIVKQALLRALSGLGDWEAHPMLTAPFDEAQAASFSRLIGVELLSLEVLEQASDRKAYFAPAAASGKHVFLDPDTGLRLLAGRDRKCPAYLFGPELVEIAGRPAKRLTLVYDQCLARGSESAGLQTKLEWLMQQGLSGLAYQSHAAFILVTPDPVLLTRARDTLLCIGRIPEHRLVESRGRTTRS